MTPLDTLEARISRFGGHTESEAPDEIFPRVAADRGEVLCRSLVPVAPSAIPPRRWAYGRFLLFGNAAVLGALDGGGKGTIATTIMLSMITGQPLLGERERRAGPVAIITYEDDEDEWRRRFAAACIQHELDYERVLAQVHFITKKQDRLTFAMMAELASRDVVEIASTPVPGLVRRVA